MPRRLWPRGLAPALVAIAAIWRAKDLVEAATDAYDRIDAEINRERYAAESAAAEANTHPKE